MFVPIHQFYVATYGTPSGNGSLAKPWDLQTALNQPATVQPGDEIWLLGGTYAGSFTSSLSGTATLPIVVRSYSGELASMDGATGNGSFVLHIQGQYTWFWNIDVTDSNPVRTDPQGLGGLRPDGVLCGAVGYKLIDSTVHDCADGIASYLNSTTPSNTEIYGCLLYNNGWQGANGGVGHNLYAQNETGTATIEDNVLFNSFGDGMQLYGSSAAYANYFNLLNNDLFDCGILNTGGSGVQEILLGTNGNIAQSPVLNGNTVYSNIPLNSNNYPTGTSAEQCLELGWYGAGAANATLTGNYFYSNYSGIELNNMSGTGITFADFSDNVLTGNNRLCYGDNITYAPDASNTLLSTKPTTNSVFVRPNAYEPGRANVTVFNWQDLPSVSVDISSAGLAIGQTYHLVDAQNFFGGPVYTGVYTGAPISLPMTLTAVAQPIGNAPVPAQHTGIEYGSFVILPVTLSVQTSQTETATSLSSSPGVAVYGQPVTFAATVTPVAPGAGVPTGTVTFSAGTVVLGTVSLDNSGNATFTTTAPLPVGTDSVSATYSGDGNFFASNTSLAGGQIVNQASTVTNVSSSGSIVYGQSVTFSATVTAVAPGAGVPTGSVIFCAGSTVLGSAPLDGSGSAKFTTKSPLPAGTNVITATYSGDLNFLAGKSSLPGGEVVARAPTITRLTTSASSALHIGTPVTLAATVADPLTGLVPTGQVQFWDGSTLLGTVTLNAQGVGSLTVKKLPKGANAIMAVYLGTTNFSGSSSSALTLFVG